MARRTFRYNKELGEMVEIIPGQDFESSQRNDGLLWGDRHYEGMQATDGSDISSRSKHREYMKQHNLTTVDDFKNTWADNAKKREAYFTKGEGGATRKEDVARAISELERRR